MAGVLEQLFTRAVHAGCLAASTTRPAAQPSRPIKSSMTALVPQYGWETVGASRPWPSAAHLYVYVYVYACVCMCMYVCVCMCMCVHVCVCMCMCVHVCACIPRGCGRVPRTVSH